ncbi:MAG TPA: S24/S26 family peptidase [Thermoanaerobaculia bacterium]|nr:S24/S26 family peptidase [Thermoanaerobaculia bacterium]
MRPSASFDALRGFAREGTVSVRVRGDCMVPFLADGSQVEVAAARLYWPGDVVVWSAPEGGLVAHRLLGYRLHRGALALVTRGDSAAVHDSPVPLSRVLGRVSGAGVSLSARGAAVRAFLGIALARLVRGRPR